MGQFETSNSNLLIFLEKKCHMLCNLHIGKSKLGYVNTKHLSTYLSVREKDREKGYINIKCRLQIISCYSGPFLAILIFWILIIVRWVSKWKPTTEGSLHDYLLATFTWAYYTEAVLQFLLNLN